ncbi:unnamed protein product [Mytilus coruscus]|uniref:Uncharacterized protein n=1 Tax=Mytilus coruscus TaxID=42192 RepID=A0A6J8ETS8_MYTCO|nr:unnamed protein product [Mytilus coruscus]
MSIVTSGDIDAVVIHLFALSRLWLRKDDRTFKIPVYVFLQKPGKIFDLYCITPILEVLEKQLQDKHIGNNFALALCLEGNDFIPKFHGMSHKKILEIFLKTPRLRCSLFNIQFEAVHSVTIDSSLYKDLVKQLYCPNKLDSSKMSLEEVRRLNIKPRQRRQNDPLAKNIRGLQLWMPPSSVLDKLVLQIGCQVDYLMTVGKSNAVLPNFLERGCLRKTESGDIEYHLGPDSFIGHINDLICLNSPSTGKEQTRKRKQKETPQKGCRRKIPLASTPNKTHK